MADTHSGLPSDTTVRLGREPLPVDVLDGPDTLDVDAVDAVTLLDSSAADTLDVDTVDALDTASVAFDLAVAPLGDFCCFLPFITH